MCISVDYMWLRIRIFLYSYMNFSVWKGGSKTMYNNDWTLGSLSWALSHALVRDKRRVLRVHRYLQSRLSVFPSPSVPLRFSVEDYRLNPRWDKNPFFILCDHELSKEGPCMNRYEEVDYFFDQGRSPSLSFSRSFDLALPLDLFFFVDAHSRAHRSTCIGIYTTGLICALSLSLSLSLSSVLNLHVWFRSGSSHIRCLA